jgi:Aspartyl/Asparaginyl beta-hydroxylase
VADTGDCVDTLAGDCVYTMNNFRYITYLDTFAATAYLHKLAPGTWVGVPARGEIGDDRLPVRSMLLRGPEDPVEEHWLEDLPNVDSEDFTKWKSLRRLLAQARKAIKTDPVTKNLTDSAATLGRVMVSNLAPDSAVIMWHVDDGPYHDKHIRFHIPLVTNPGVQMYSAHENLHMPVGSLWLFNNRVKHSAANWGSFSRIHVVFEVRRFDADPPSDG